MCVCKCVPHMSGCLWRSEAWDPLELELHVLGTELGFSRRASNIILLATEPFLQSLAVIGLTEIQI